MIIHLLHPTGLLTNYWTVQVYFFFLQNAMFFMTYDNDDATDLILCLQKPQLVAITI